MDIDEDIRHWPPDLLPALHANIRWLHGEVDIPGDFQMVTAAVNLSLPHILRPLLFFTALAARDLKDMLEVVRMTIFHFFGRSQARRGDTPGGCSTKECIETVLAGGMSPVYINKSDRMSRLEMIVGTAGSRDIVVRGGGRDYSVLLGGVEVFVREGHIGDGYHRHDCLFERELKDFALLSDWGLKIGEFGGMHRGDEQFLTMRPYSPSGVTIEPWDVIREELRRELEDEVRTALGALEGLLGMTDSLPKGETPLDAHILGEILYWRGLLIGAREDLTACEVIRGQWVLQVDGGWVDRRRDALVYLLSVLNDCPRTLRFDMFVDPHGLLDCLQASIGCDVLVITRDVATRDVTTRDYFRLVNFDCVSTEGVRLQGDMIISAGEVDGDYAPIRFDWPDGFHNIAAI